MSLASGRGGWIEAIDLRTLETVSRIRVPEMTESVASDTSGQRLFVAAPSGPGKGCCALFAMDLQSMQLSFLVKPALSATVTAGRLFTKRGAVGIEVFDLQSLKRQPAVKAPGNYRLLASPDGHLLFGITRSPSDVAGSIRRRARCVDREPASIRRIKSGGSMGRSAVFPSIGAIRGRLTCDR